MKNLMLVLVFSSVVFSKDIGIRFGFINTITSWETDLETSYRFNPLGKANTSYSMGGEFGISISKIDYLQFVLSYKGYKQIQTHDLETVFYSLSDSPEKSYDVELSQSILMSKFSFEVIPQIPMGSHSLGVVLGVSYVPVTELQEESTVDGYSIDYESFLESIKINHELPKLTPKNTVSFNFGLNYSYDINDILTVGTYVSYEYFYESIYASDPKYVEVYPDFYSVGTYLQINFAAGKSSGSNDNGVKRKAIN